MASPWLTASLRPRESTRLHIGGGIYRRPADLERQAGTKGGGPALRPEGADLVDASVAQSLPSSNFHGGLVCAPGTGGVVDAPRGAAAAGGRRCPTGTEQCKVGGRSERPRRGVELIVRRDARPAYELGGLRTSGPSLHECIYGDSYRSDAEQRTRSRCLGVTPLESDDGRIEISLWIQLSADWVLRRRPAPARHRCSAVAPRSS